MAKPKSTITVRQERNESKDANSYRVEKLVNTTQPQIGNYLTEKQVNELIARGANVVIVPAWS